MDGIDATTGKRLGGIAHLRQSIRNILTTRKGTRVMRRDYGSNLPALIDAPMNRDTLLEIYAETAGAILRWEPRFRPTKVTTASARPGRVELVLSGIYMPDGQAVTLDGIVIT